ncbi:MAG TPA: tyrosine-protein phosphatase [Planctomycetota bacterium]|nr:tyrosine-protein phosphatase [Planctomycetota bacterium]HRR80342.1 tyrosine-protein phosphatase [Planctomycetota bacterium]HRT94148.1 tyrosine-protein phosphatase [Planctomycetota bacterium]
MDDRRRLPTLALLLLWVAAGIYLGARSLEPDEEDAMETEVPLRPGDPDGVPNFRRVTPELLRGAQPSTTGFRMLRAMGVKTIINLRHYHSDRYMLEKIPGLDYVPINIKGWSLYNGHVARFLAVVSDPGRTPVFLHCNDGIGRTGVLCAMYRILVCGWSKEDALRELREVGEIDARVMQKLLEHMDQLDVDAIRRLARLEARTP